MKKSAIFIVLACVLMIAPMALAQNWQSAVKEVKQEDGSIVLEEAWIEKWWGLDLVTETGGFATSAETDYLSEGTDGAITNASVSTRLGAGKTAYFIVKSKTTGAWLTWSVITLDIEDQNNMSSSHGFVDVNNITWHGIIAIISPDDRTTTMHPAHDDHAQIWLNGDMVYDVPDWTGGVQSVTNPTEIQLHKGENFLHLKCGEGGGGDYVNLRFELTDDDLLIAPTLDNQFLDILTPVEPKGKLATQWADIKRQ